MPEDRDVIGIAVESGDDVTHPFTRPDLIPHSVILTLATTSVHRRPNKSIEERERKKKGGGVERKELQMF